MLRVRSKCFRASSFMAFRLSPSVAVMHTASRRWSESNVDGSIDKKGEKKVGWLYVWPRLHRRESDYEADLTLVGEFNTAESFCR